MREIIYQIADKEGLTIAEVLIIFRFSLVLDKNNNIREKYASDSLLELWEKIPDKKYWLRIYKELKKKKKRKRRKA